MQAFVGQVPEGNIVRHLNDVKWDNQLDNLAYGTLSENYWDAVDNGNRVPGLQVEQLTLDGELLATYTSTGHAARVLSINHGGVYDAASGSRGMKTYKGFKWRFVEPA